MLPTYATHVSDSPSPSSQSTSLILYLIDVWGQIVLLALDTQTFAPFSPSTLHVSALMPSPTPHHEIHQVREEDPIFLRNSSHSKNSTLSLSLFWTFEENLKTLCSKDFSKLHNHHVQVSCLILLMMTAGKRDGNSSRIESEHDYCCLMLLIIVCTPLFLFVWCCCLPSPRFLDFRYIFLSVTRKRILKFWKREREREMIPKWIPKLILLGLSLSSPSFHRWWESAQIFTKRSARNVERRRFSKRENEYVDLRERSNDFSPEDFTQVPLPLQMLQRILIMKSMRSENCKSGWSCLRHCIKQRSRHGTRIGTYFKRLKEVKRKCKRENQYLVAKMKLMRTNYTKRCDEISCRESSSNRGEERQQRYGNRTTCNPKRSWWYDASYRT